jgi:2-polyprenyl-3-methyl-5-hydroxy-6-metoxy-1,4-benzoquinol methylase
MDAVLLKEGLDYAERNFKSLDSHSYLDKTVIKEKFDLQNKNVLDFGCGMGNMSLWFASEMGAIVDGVDIDENHITVANELNKKHQIKNVTFHIKNIISNPIDKQYDFIFLNDVIEHIKEEWIQGILDVLILKNLKQGGIIFFSYPPWEGPHASHLQRAIKIPWIQFLPHNFVLKQISKHNQKLVGRNDLLEEYLELNHMNHKKLMSYLNKYNLKPILRKSHTKLNKIGFFKDVNFNSFPFKYIVTKELIAFQKV